MISFFKAIFGSSQERVLKKLKLIVKQINVLSEQFDLLSDEEIQYKTKEFRNRLQNGETCDDILPEVYAVVKTACKRRVGIEMEIFGYNQKWDMVPYDVQLLGAIALHKGFIAEMKTGEGKTLTAVMPLYLNALSGKPVHLVTVNDYLAERDCLWVGSLLRFLGLSTGVVKQDMNSSERREAYLKDVVYGTASEFGFDYLRDNSIATSKEEQVQRGFSYAIVDEIDSILIDESRTPLIISGPGKNKSQVYDSLKEDVISIVKAQKAICNKIASDVKIMLAPFMKEGVIPKNKASKEVIVEACRKLWIIEKGMPLNKVLRTIKEIPEFRAQIEAWDLIYTSDQKKQEKLEALSELLIIVEERNQDFEVTEKGIDFWSKTQGGSYDDFVMLDVGFELSQLSDLVEEEADNKKQDIIAVDLAKKERSHGIRQMLRAHLLMEKDIDYIVDDEKIVIIDENTGRPQPGRRFSNGLHQAIEAKEDVAIQRENQTYASITLQNYFRMYSKLSGMTGTALTEAQEFKDIYNLEVLQIPTYKHCLRVDHHDEVYMTEREKYNAILKEIIDINGKGRPILIGTESVEASEKLSRILKQNKIEHTVLNARHHAKEAEIIAEAGSVGAVTVSTNMAGRGTDIKLDREAAVVGGLHVIGTTRHHSRRIDRQLVGRCGRLGDPGSTKFFVSFEDNLMRLFASQKINAVLQRFRPPEGEALSDSMLNRVIETAQKRIEVRNYASRKQTLEYDNIMNAHRKEIYAFRNEIIREADIISLIKEVVHDAVGEVWNRAFVKEEERVSDETAIRFANKARETFSVNYDKNCLVGKNFIEAVRETESYIGKLLSDKIVRDISLTEVFLNRTIDAKKWYLEICRSLLVRSLDNLWQEHLNNMDVMRYEVGLRSFGQKDPLLEFKNEAFVLFNNFRHNLLIQITKHVCHFDVTSMFGINFDNDVKIS